MLYRSTVYEAMLYEVPLYQCCTNPWIRTTDFLNTVRTQLRTTLAFNVVKINGVQGNIGTVASNTTLYESNGVHGNIVLTMCESGNLQSKSSESRQIGQIESRKSNKSNCSLLRIKRIESIERIDQFAERIGRI